MKLNPTEQVSGACDRLAPVTRRIIRGGRRILYISQAVGAIAAMSCGSRRTQEIGGYIFLANLGVPMVIAAWRALRRNSPEPPTR